MGEGELRVSEKEAKAQMTARMVAAKVSKALALNPNECIFEMGSLNEVHPTVQQPGIA